MKETKTVVNTSLPAFVAEIEEAINRGWRVDFEENIPVTWGTLYECGMIRGDDPKMSRAETLALARAAKAAKKQDVVNMQ